MEPDTPSNGPVKPPPLNSDQLNYLIWRYLQEAGYGEAAVKLQKDWKVKAESLPFAKHIKGQALISLVQKGLRYHHLSLTIDDDGQQTKLLEPSMFFFGPGDARPDTTGQEPLVRAIEPRRTASPLSVASGGPRKRETDFNGLSDPAPQSHKRSRRPVPTTDRNGVNARKPSAPPPSSNYDHVTAMEIDTINGLGLPQSLQSPSAGEPQHDDRIPNGVDSESRMDLDGDVHVSTGTESITHDVANHPIPPLIPTLTHGESIGIQVAPAKVANLNPSTLVLPVTEGQNVMKTAWRPGERAILTASGHHFCGSWRLNGNPGQDPGINPSYEELLTPEDSRLITAFAWASNGSALAIATWAEQGGQIHIYDGHDLALLETLPGSQREITSLKWLPNASSLVGIVPGEDGETSTRNTASILTWDISAMQDGQIPEPETQEAPSSEMLLDMDTAEEQDNGVVFAAGRQAVYRYSYRLRSTDLDGKKSKVLTIFEPPTPKRDNWSFVRCRTQKSGEEPFVIVASADTACLWLPSQRAVKPDAHSAAITGLEIRPRAFQGDHEASFPQFATSSVDGSIQIWAYEPSNNTIRSLHRIAIDQSSSIMALSFSPDGFCLTGASYGQLHIWNAEHGYNLMASWQGVEHEWRGSLLKEEDIMSNGGMSSSNGDNGVLASEHNLAWDADSRKLAFGLGSQVAIINFQR